MTPEKYQHALDAMRTAVRRPYRKSGVRVAYSKPKGRDRDRVLVAKRPANDPRDAIDAVNEIVPRIGLKALPRADWVEISAPDASAHLARALTEHLVYGSEILPRRVAADIAERVINLLPGARHFTNGRFPPNVPPDFSVNRSYVGFPPLTESLQDTGIVMVDDENVVVVWCESDD